MRGTNREAPHLAIFSTLPLLHPLSYGHITSTVYIKKELYFWPDAWTDGAARLFQVWVFAFQLLKLSRLHEWGIFVLFSFSNYI